MIALLCFFLTLSFCAHPIGRLHSSFGICCAKSIVLLAIASRSDVAARGARAAEAFSRFKPSTRA
jgi:hypothetical protein